MQLGLVYRKETLLDKIKLKKSAKNVRTQLIPAQGACLRGEVVNFNETMKELNEHARHSGHAAEEPEDLRNASTIFDGITE
ncbi:hypothetical protein SS50377_23915 [Spironucleus salmonicida]|uniref:Uncharacterized protein n=1 Tax=Spironucleus salmonicida TaxID=348837 RepID=V6LUR5_9EUKA|nr:hypothetical protein SS50377_23915 [Spironucleus salmonicida]|eukprot:EST48310.1 Hypothetical protein SS50377_11511 [Spironucleus salmonicida]